MPMEKMLCVIALPPLKLLHLTDPKQHRVHCVTPTQYDPQRQLNHNSSISSIGFFGSFFDFSMPRADFCRKVLETLRARELVL